MCEGEYHAPTTHRNFRNVCIVGTHLVGLALKDPLTTARSGAPVSMAGRADKVDAFLSLNEPGALTRAGRLRMDVAQKLAVERFEMFDAHWRATEAVAAEANDVGQLEEVEKRRKKAAEDA